MALHKRALPVAGMSDPDIRKAATKRAIIPVGSLEQHGAHLPVSTDALIAEHISNQVATRVGALVLPAIAYGVSFEHSPMFNVSLQNRTLAAVVCDACASLAETGVKEIIIINSHHGNMGALQYVAQELKGRVPAGVSVHTLHYWHALKQEFDHAGEVETSLVLAIAPDLVRMERAKPGAKKPTKSKAAYASMTGAPGSFVRITGNGVWGDPRKASAEKGRRMVKDIVQGLVRTISELA
jgi:creatinine amidohydrolase